MTYFLLFAPINNFLITFLNLIILSYSSQEFTEIHFKGFPLAYLLTTIIVLSLLLILSHIITSVHPHADPVPLQNYQTFENQDDDLDTLDPKVAKKHRKTLENEEEIELEGIFGSYSYLNEA